MPAVHSRRAARIASRRGGWSRSLWLLLLGIALDRLVPEPPGAVHPVVLFGFVMTPASSDACIATAKGAGVVHASSGPCPRPRRRGRRALDRAGHVLGRGRARARPGGARTSSGRSRAERPRAGPWTAPGAGRARPERLSTPAKSPGPWSSRWRRTRWTPSWRPRSGAPLAGAPGALGYRAVNTLDSMVGHRSPRYANYGWASARLDDALAWVPARLTAALVALVRPRTARADLAGRAAPGPRPPVAERGGGRGGVRRGARVSGWAA